MTMSICSLAPHIGLSLAHDLSPRHLEVEGISGTTMDICLLAPHIGPSLAHDLSPHHPGVEGAFSMTMAISLLVGHRPTLSPSLDLHQSLHPSPTLSTRVESRNLFAIDHDLCREVRPPRSI